jgi:uncharacterized protein (DUF1800 family)
LGRGAYREADIAQAARAFTGWGVRRNAHHLDRRQHDRGVKTVFGERGELGGEDVVRIALAQDACPRFLAAKLIAWFVEPSPRPADVAALGGFLQSHDLDIGAAVETLLGSRRFFAAEVYRCKIKSPIDFLVGTTRMLRTGQAPRSLAQAAAQLGQALLEPPSVAGWDGEKSWISSATWILRSNFAAKLAAQPEVFSGIDAAEPLLEAVRTTLFDGELPARSWRRLREIADQANSPAARRSAVLHGALVLPEFHMS